MTSKIPSSELGMDDIPGKEASWAEIEKFALTYDGYDECGSFEQCVEIRNQPRATSLPDLRTCLFFELGVVRSFGTVAGVI
jgi:hypothetical protein